MQSFAEETITQSNNTTNDMVCIPSGTFLMGAENWGEFESPIQEVYVEAFLMDKNPVTNAEFAQFVAETQYQTTAEKQGHAIGYENGEQKDIQGLCWKTYATEERQQHPVVMVSWFDAQAYATWAGKRLPTEAEWEKAARGGLEQNLYPWGNNEPTATTCNFAKTTLNLPPTTPVETYTPNGYGLFDMAGNVWNWCADWFGVYETHALMAQNPTGATHGETKVRRGASFNIIQTFRLRCSNRGAYKPENFAINIGFRCAKNL